MKPAIWEAILADYDSSMKVGRVFPVERGNLNKFKIYPKAINEYVEKNDEVQDIVEAGVIVGQIFKASSNNIDNFCITAESAQARTELDELETGTYANDPALQAVWVKAGTEEAVRELTIIQNPSEHGGTSDMSMKLDTSNNDGEWEATTLALPINAATIDMTDFIFELDHYQTHAPDQQIIMIYIEDGAAARSTFNLIADDLAAWKHFNIDINAFIGTADITDITKIGFDMVLKRIGSFAYIDNLNYLIVAGSINMKLFDLGDTLPVGDGATFDLTTDSTQYTELGASGDKSEISVPLLGGNRLYHVSDFIAGRNGTTKLTIDNYYAITLNYVDEDVSIYGHSATDLYSNGYAFNTSAENVDISQVGGVGSNNNIMFYLWSAVDAWIGINPQVPAYHMHFIDANGDLVSPGQNSDWITHIEDAAGKIDITTLHGGHPVAGGDYSQQFMRPIFIPIGGFLDIEYNHDPEGSDHKIEVEAFYIYKRTIANL